MKYLYLKSKESINSKMIKFILVYLALVTIYMFLNKGGPLNEYLGLNSIIDKDEMTIILKILGISLTIFLTYKIYLFDIIENSQNIFLRTNKKKILISNLFLTIIVFICLVRLILILIVKIISSMNLKILLLDLLYYSFISLFSIALINTISRRKIYTYVISTLIFLTMISSMFINATIQVCLIFIVIGLILNVIMYSPQHIMNYFKNSI